MHGINLNISEQFKELKALSKFYEEMPFSDTPKDDLRYGFLNDWFSYSDGTLLYCMLRKYKPKRIVEIGCGHSSLLMLDTNRIHQFTQADRFTFIDPHLSQFQTLEGYMIDRVVQSVPLNVFEVLEANDILSVDSSHTASHDGDVNFLLFEVLPILQPGVLIHFHDIHYPFEYPSSWRNRPWNEAFMLRAFLQFNKEFEIVIWNNFLYREYTSKLEHYLPLCRKNPGGSLWLKRL